MLLLTLPKVYELCSDADIEESCTDDPAQFPTAFVSAVVGIVDSAVAARENGSKYGYAVSPNRELVALGMSNLSASLMSVTGCVPVFGSITRE
jgi:MFS superfamily sulfate permease-like transporter